MLTSDAVIGGSVSGSVVVTNRLELQSTCVVDGEVSTRAEHLKMEEGARFSGKVLILQGEAGEAVAPVSEAAPAEPGGWTENGSNSSLEEAGAGAIDSGHDQ